MFSHIRIGTNDLGRSRAFYDRALGALGVGEAQEMGGGLLYRTDEGMFMVAPPREGEATHANGGTIGFKAASHEAIDRFHAEGVAAGGRCEGEPGPRAAYGVYAAYLRDPDGNKLCAIAPLG